MKLTFLGTSHGVPAADRYTSCYLLEAGGNLYIFDAGAPVTDLLLRRGEDLKRVKAFFNSHCHADHLHGGIAFLALCNWFFTDTNLDALLPDQVAKNLVEQNAWASDDGPFSDGRVRLQVMEPGVVFDDGVIKVTAIPVEHARNNGKKSYGFCIEGEGKRLLYTGDLSGGLAKGDFPQVALESRFDLILTECAHFSVAALEAYMPKVDTHYFAVSHIWPPEKFGQLEALRGKYPFELLIPNDGDELQL
jgi:glyoxylase-like metal-dependent hydrolase (beta-lactamase superfamily II)